VEREVNTLKSATQESKKIELNLKQKQKKESWNSKRSCQNMGTRIYTSTNMLQNENGNENENESNKRTKDISQSGTGSNTDKAERTRRTWHLFYLDLTAMTMERR
jgi:hypothetical protein